MRPRSSAAPCQPRPSATNAVVQLSRLNDAITELNQAVELDPENVKYHDALDKLQKAVIKEFLMELRRHGIHFIGTTELKNVWQNYGDKGKDEGVLGETLAAGRRAIGSNRATERLRELAHQDLGVDDHCIHLLSVEIVAVDLRMMFGARPRVTVGPTGREHQQDYRPITVLPPSVKR